MVGLDKLTLSRKPYIQSYPKFFSLIIFANQQNITHICNFIITGIAFPHSVAHVVISLYVNRIELEHVFMSFFLENAKKIFAFHFIEKVGVLHAS
jgi:hypothetical protein